MRMRQLATARWPLRCHYRIRMQCKIFSSHVTSHKDMLQQKLCITWHKATIECRVAIALSSEHYEMRHGIIGKANITSPWLCLQIAPFAVAEYSLLISLHLAKARTTVSITSCVSTHLQPWPHQLKRCKTKHIQRCTCLTTRVLSDSYSRDDKQMQIATKQRQQQSAGRPF